MAIDTRHKRFSMMNFVGGEDIMLFEPDGSVDLDDRQHLLDCYSGIAFAGVSRVDDRSIAGRVIIAFATGDLFRLRVQRTSGSDNLQTVSGGSAITVEVLK